MGIKRGGVKNVAATRDFAVFQTAPFSHYVPPLCSKFPEIYILGRDFGEIQGHFGDFSGDSGEMTGDSGEETGDSGKSWEISGRQLDKNKSALANQTEEKR